MRAVLGPPPQFRAADAKTVWYRIFDDVVDSPDEQAAQAIEAFAKNASGRWGLNARRLDGYGPDAARTLAHAVAARAEIKISLPHESSDLHAIDAIFASLVYLTQAAARASRSKHVNPLTSRNSKFAPASRRAATVLTLPRAAAACANVRAASGP